MSDDPNPLIQPDSGTVVVEPPAAVEPPALAPTAPPAKEPPAWAMKRISEESARAREAVERAVAAERRATEAEALAQRLQARPAGDGAQPAPQPQQQAPADPNARQAEVQAEAARQRFYEDTVDVRNRGIRQFGAAFTETLSILGALGATTDDFIQDVLAVDKAGAHATLKQIAADPEKAVALTQMTSRQRIAELTRMTMAEGAKPEPAAAEPKPPALAAKGVSKAPAPPPVIQPSTTKAVHGYSDEATDEQFTARFQEVMKRGSARR